MKFCVVCYYYDKMSQLFIDIDTDVKLITGQTEDVQFFTYQTSPWLGVDIGDGPIPTMNIQEAQIQVVKDFPNVHLCGAMYQFAYANEGASSMLMGTVLQRSKKTANVDWTPWEYINPPMKLGVEYRTTERYLSKPVYCQVIDCGVITANTQKEIIKSIPVLDVLSCEGVIHTNSNGHNQATPFDYQLTDGTKYSVTVSAEAYKQSEADILYIYVNSSWAVTGSVCAIVRYTKETDQ